MRIAVTSDVHLFPRWANKVAQLAEQIRRLEPDLLILAGDTGEPIDMFTEGLSIFKRACENRAVIAGNHDVWHREGPHKSQFLWESLLHQAADVFGYKWLEDENLILEGIGICGSVAWYDYGGHHPSLEFDDEFYRFIKSRVSNDASYIDWEWSDLEFAELVSSAFVDRLETLNNDNRVENILVVTHVPLFAECVKPVDNLLQGISNAYYANVSLGQKVTQYSKVRAVVSGHVHYEQKLTVDRGNNGTSPLHVYTNPADYGAPAATLIDTDTWETEIVHADLETAPLSRRRI